MSKIPAYQHSIIMTFQIWTSPCDGPVTASSTVKKGQIQEGIPQRKKEVVGLNAQIRDLEIRHQEWQLSEERDRHRPRMVRLHAQIVAIQQQMALLWSQYTAKVMPATRDTEAATLDIANKFAPIYCLPPEVLSEIFMAAVMENDHLALDLIRVCRYWRLVLLALPRIWSKIRVGAITSSEKIEYLVEIAGRTALDVEIDTESDAIVWTSGLCPYYPALIVLAGTSVRWGSLTIRSFPKEEKLLELEALWAPITFNAPLANLKSFRMTRPCEMNTALGNLIDHTRKAEKSKLTILELSSASALYRFAEASFTVFHFLRVFKVDLPEMDDPLDLLPHFQNLEDMYVHRLRIPLYAHTVHLPLTRTLKRLFLKRTSVQWMNNRTFPNLVECTIIWPRFPETLLGQSGVNLSPCISFTYDDHLLQPLGAFKLSSVDKLVIRNEAWNRPRGGQQLGFIWGPSISIESILRPRVLHLDTQCYDQHLITILKKIPQVEELVLGLVRPHALGKQFLLAMVAKEGRGNPNPTSNEAAEGVSTIDSSPAWTASLCPNLRVLGLKYRRWLRESENDELIPLLQKIVETRSKSDMPLHSFKFWPTNGIPEQWALELVK
jgi:hypothetical protein